MVISATFCIIPNTSSITCWNSEKILPRLDRLLTVKLQFKPNKASFSCRFEISEYTVEVHPCSLVFVHILLYKSSSTSGDFLGRKHQDKCVQVMPTRPGHRKLQCCRLLVVLHVCLTFQLSFKLLILNVYICFQSIEQSSWDPSLCAHMPPKLVATHNFWRLYQNYSTGNAIMP